MDLAQWDDTKEQVIKLIRLRSRDQTNDNPGARSTENNKRSRKQESFKNEHLAILSSQSGRKMKKGEVSTEKRKNEKGTRKIVTSRCPRGSQGITPYKHYNAVSHTIQYYYHLKSTDLTVSRAWQRLYQIIPLCDGSTEMCIHGRIPAYRSTPPGGLGAWRPWVYYLS